MSYIRCLSNPEGLYIYGTGKNTVDISIDYKIHSMPEDVFKRVLLKWDVWHGDEVTQYEGASIREVKRGRNYKIKFSYKDWSFVMWEVTCVCLVRNIRSQIRRDKRFERERQERNEKRQIQRLTKQLRDSSAVH